MDSTHHHATGGGRALEQSLVFAGLALAVSYRFFEPIWQVGAGLSALGLLTGLAYLAGSALHRRSERPGPWRAALLTVVVSQPMLLALWMLDLPVSRIGVGFELTLLFVAVASATVRAPGSVRLLVGSGFAALAALPTVIGLTQPSGQRSGHAGAAPHYVFTSYHDLSVTTHQVIDDELQAGGALTLLPDGRVLLVAGSGTARLLDFGEGVGASPVELGLPIDVEAYRALGRREPQFYRVFDVLYDAGRLFASYIHWDAANECYALRLAEAELEGSKVGPWTTRFESRPCVVNSRMANTSGGRIAVLDEARLLLSVGAFGTSGVDHELNGKDTDYGKIFVLDRSTWRSEVFSSGHRNPQGLLVADGDVWSTEHGPHGGDELNLVREGSDYGWPFVSYGTDYGLKTLSRGRTPGDHSGFTQPAYAWIPSVGISSLIRVAGGAFPRWGEDLLIGSLSGLGNGRALLRVRLLQGRPVTVERVVTGRKVRDLVQLPGGGPLVLWDGDGNVSVVRPADHVFSQCAACHIVRNSEHGIGPDLYDVVGSEVGRHVGYRYSAALQRYGGTWTPRRLDRFLESPQQEVPGTSMEHGGVPDAGERAQIIGYLSEMSAGRPVD